MTADLNSLLSLLGKVEKDPRILAFVKKNQMLNLSAVAKANFVAEDIAHTAAVIEHLMRLLFVGKGRVGNGYRLTSASNGLYRTVDVKPDRDSEFRVSIHTKIGYLYISV